MKLRSPPTDGLAAMLESRTVAEHSESDDEQAKATPLSVRSA